ncbi:MAG: hypothetical protein ACKVS9_02620, partial [Phycisphaerae bacterium]
TGDFDSQRHGAGAGLRFADDRAASAAARVDSRGEYSGEVLVRGGRCGKGRAGRVREVNGGGQI